MKNINYQKTRSVKNPEKAHSTDAGIDFFIPEDFPQMRLFPGESILIPSGIIIELPENHMGLFLNKSGIASQKCLLVGAQVIDEKYRGEVHIDLHNVGNQEIILEPGMKIVQLVIVPIWDGQPKQVESIDTETDRGTCGFGSTGI